MKKGQICEGIAETMRFPNRTLVRCEDGTAVVKNALPGQKVRFSVSKVRNQRAEGRLLEVLERAPIEKTEDVCPKAGICGGCLFQTFPYEEQLRIKEGQVRELLAQAVEDPRYEGLFPSPVSEGYRNKMEFSFGDEVKDGPLVLGLHKRGSFHDIVPAQDCRIVTGDYRRIVAYTQEYFASREISYYHTYTHEGYLRHLVVRRAVKTGELLVNLVTTSAQPADLDLADYAAGLQALPFDDRLMGILHTVNDRVSDVVSADRLEVLFGQETITEEILGLRFEISPFSFFQTNSLGAEVLYEQARRYIGDTKDMTVFDLYSGTGTIAQIAASVAKKVIGVEIVPEAVEAARANALANGLDNCEFIAGDVLKVLDEIEEKPDLIILDPPRDGINPKALKKILAYGVEKIVYISCKPTSLVRDLEEIQAAGYAVEKSCGVDMFPHTANVETVCCLYHQKKDFISVPYEPKNDSYMNQLK